MKNLKCEMENLFSAPSAPRTLGQAGMPVLLKVFNECRFDHIYSHLADIGYVIANSFQVFSYEKQSRVSRRGCRFGHHHLNQAMKDMVVEIVDFGIALDNLAGRGGIIRSKGVQGRVQ